MTRTPLSPSPEARTGSARMTDPPLTPRPHVAERRALRHIVIHDLDDATLREVNSTALPAAAPVDGGSGSSWRDLLASVQATDGRPGRVLVTGPEALERAVLDVVTPLCDEASAWDGRTVARTPDLLIGALPWRYEEIGEVPDLPGPLNGPRPAVLPLAFTGRSVTVGPVAGAGRACAACVIPAYGNATGRPEPALAPALFAFAAGATGLFLRAFSARNLTACSLSLTFDMAAPHVEHRLWACTATCGRAA